MVQAFKSATVENVLNSLLEPGIARFDLLEQSDDPTRFSLVEVYRTPEDPGKHKETSHYKKWLDAVADMMAEPRTRTVYHNVFPGEQGW